VPRSGSSVLTGWAVEAEDGVEKVLAMTCRTSAISAVRSRELCDRRFDAVLAVVDLLRGRDADVTSRSDPGSGRSDTGERRSR
jgi:hypothetical protein